MKNESGELAHAGRSKSQGFCVGILLLTFVARAVGPRTGHLPKRETRRPGRLNFARAQLAQDHLWEPGIVTYYREEAMIANCQRGLIKKEELPEHLWSTWMNRRGAQNGPWW